MEQFSINLFNWKVNLFFSSCRITLEKSVMEAVLIYLMMTNMLPKTCINKVKSLEIEKRKYHAIN